MSAGDIFKRAMLAVDPVATQYGGRMFLSVHDELVFLIPKKQLHPFIRHAVAVMEQPPTPWFQIPIKVEVKVGRDGEVFDHLVEHLAVLAGQADDGRDFGAALALVHDRGHLDRFRPRAEDQEGP